MCTPAAWNAPTGPGSVSAAAKSSLPVQDSLKLPGLSPKPSTAILYSVPLVALKTAWLWVVTPGTSSFSATEVNPVREVPVYTDSTVSKSVFGLIVRKMALPVAGAVHRYHIEACAGLPACAGSPTSALAPLPDVRPPTELFGPGRNWANWKLSLAGAANAGAARASPAPVVTAARAAPAMSRRGEMDMSFSLVSGDRSGLAGQPPPTVATPRASTLSSAYSGWSPGRSG